MADHKFKIGQMVLFYPGAGRRIIVPRNRPYQITRRLPEASGQPQYQIRCTVTGEEFVTSDKELRAVA